MEPIRTVTVVALLVPLALARCDRPDPATAARPQASTPSPASPPAPGEESAARPPWKERSIPVAEAVERLQRHVDVPVVLPRLAGVRNPREWRADPKYLDWGAGAGGMTIRRGRQILILSYGRAGFDGCGDRTHAVETNVLGRPALVTQSPEHVWSHVLWPVTARGSTGRYGLAGTFTAWQIVRLAESMEAARVAARDHLGSC
ncbi:MAG: hypothetical protein M3217_07955 [Actinomycetota bacterium]|nr:hypothetical protein [Actinomycetota bacterium]